MRKFKILTRRHYGKIGTLVGAVDYCGCYSGWHTLMIENHGKVLCTGDEIEEITNTESVSPDCAINDSAIPEILKKT